MPERPTTTTLKIYEFNPKAAVQAGVNPIKITETTIPYEERIPRREKRALERVAQLTGRKPSLSHATDGAVIATVYVQTAVSG